MPIHAKRKVPWSSDSYPKLVKKVENKVIKMSFNVIKPNLK